MLPHFLYIYVRTGGTYVAPFFVHTYNNMYVQVVHMLPHFLYIYVTAHMFVATYLCTYMYVHTYSTYVRNYICATRIHHLQ